MTADLIPAGAPLFHVARLPPAGPFVLDGPEGRHAATVRRMRTGETLVLTDGLGGWAVGSVTSAGRAELTVELSAARVSPESAPRVVVVQALPKGERSDLAVDLATEAGADVIIPWAAARCVARWVGEKADRGVAKWRQVAHEASKQSRRTRFAQVEPLSSTSDIADRIALTVHQGGTALVLHESAARTIAGVGLPATADLLLIIGPEGGVSPDELAAFAAAGANAVRLGPQVLRTSTAAAVALGAIGVLTPRWS